MFTRITTGLAAIAKAILIDVSRHMPYVSVELRKYLNAHCTAPIMRVREEGPAGGPAARKAGRILAGWLLAGRILADRGQDAGGFRHASKDQGDRGLPPWPEERSPH
ncbi:hypothetical protein [Paracoccus sp. IB05]|uniref:hypothetical protein n=1 Tax=Paracoccus sp. IB05 TaxID=2779367 RepID=UPI0018E8AB15|nr:hypothetical protein [Paracoccus sp. IB05]MBJ2150365.1 hypothetical protein [Paracoccus sp. IB05]